MKVYVVCISEDGEYIGHGLYTDTSYVYCVCSTVEKAQTETEALIKQGFSAWYQPFDVR